VKPNLLSNTFVSNSYYIERTEMAKRRVMFTFTPETSAEPIIYNIGQQFNIVTNIRKADAPEGWGWIVVELEGEDKDIEDGIAWVISKGIRVDLIGDEAVGI